MMIRGRIVERGAAAELEATPLGESEHRLDLRARDDESGGVIFSAALRLTVPREREGFLRHLDPLVRDEAARLLAAIVARLQATPTDLGNAKRLVASAGHDLRFNKAFGMLHYREGRWCRDVTGEAVRRAKAVLQRILQEAGEYEHSEDRKRWAAHALRSMSRGGIQAMVELAQTEPEVAVAIEELDRDPDILVVRNGVVDLRTGVLREHRREDLVTMRSPVAYEPGATSPTWLDFLNVVFNYDEELIGFVQRAIGYTLTGRTSEQVLFFAHGTGANGKGALVRTIAAVLGEYGRATPFTTFLQSQAASIREDLADLVGRRFVHAEESSQGRRLDEALVKSLVGEDEISCRLLHRDRFVYRPLLKLWLASNSKPRIEGSDFGIWRRILLIPFAVTIPAERRDPGVEARMQGEEIAGVLRWAVDGAREWYRIGLRPPESVRRASQVYRQEQDLVGQFIEETCELGDDYREPMTAIFAAWQRWEMESGLPRKRAIQWLSEELEGKGLRKVHESGTRRAFRIGLRLKFRPVEGSQEGGEGRNGHFRLTQVPIFSREPNQKTPFLPSPPSGAGEGTPGAAA